VENPFKFTVYDKSFVAKCEVNDPLSLVMTPRHNQKGSGFLIVGSDHPKLDHLTAQGARFVCTYFGEFLMSGKIHIRAGQGPKAKGTVTLYLEDDFRLLGNTRGWPVPTAALTAQTSEYYTVTGDAETIVKDVVTQNITNRLGRPVTCATNLNRGATVPSGLKFRFEKLQDVLFPAVEQAGLGVTFRQSGTGIVCDVYEPGVYDHPLTEESGIVQAWSFSEADAEATRVVVGGSGDGTARVFRGVPDSALETAENDVIELFVDARDESDNTKLDARGQTALDENAGKAGFSLTLSETDNFRYGGTNGLHVGDTVTVDLGFTSRTDVLREVTLSYARDGLKVTPVIGDVRDTPDKRLAMAIRKIWTSVENLKVRK
jgi:hypothetical protein